MAAFLLLTFLLSCSYSSGLASPFSYRGDSNYHHKVILDPKYHLEWLIDWPQERVIFNVTAETLGYVGVGVSLTGSVKHGDLIVGGVISETGSAYFFDKHDDGYQDAPLPDASQHWRLEQAWENVSHTFLSVSRPLQSCDKEQYLPIDDNGIYLIWSYGVSDNVTRQEGSKRGSFFTYLTDPDFVPAEVSTSGPFSNESSTLPVELAKQGVQVWSIRDKFTIPAKRTTLRCTIHKISLPRKHHIIGFNFHINHKIKSNMHHMLFFRCLTHPRLPVASIFEPLVDSPGEECYSPSTPFGKIPMEYCYEIKIGHAIGGPPLFFPDNMGVPIGESGLDEYFLTHYDNPGSIPNVEADVQLDIYHTPNLRANDGGTVSVGHDVPGGASILVPPGMDSHIIYGHCATHCTKNLLPPEGIKVTAAMLHSHNAGRKISILHFRNGQELPPLLEDNNYRFTYQPMRLLKNERLVLPGDQITVRCHYSTKERNTTVVGSFGTNAEMCKTFLVYHSLVPDFFVCRSAISTRSQQYLDSYLAGAKNISWDMSMKKLEFLAGEPSHLKGMTMSEISDSKFVNWDKELRDKLQSDHQNMKQVTLCPKANDLVSGKLPALLAQPQFVSYPSGARNWDGTNDSYKKCQRTNSVFAKFATTES